MTAGPAVLIVILAISHMEKSAILPRVPPWVQASSLLALVQTHSYILICILYHIQDLKNNIVVRFNKISHKKCHKKILTKYFSQSPAPKLLWQGWLRLYCSIRRQLTMMEILIGSIFAYEPFASGDPVFSPGEIFT